jgi:hypothetical protein
MKILLVYDIVVTMCGLLAAGCCMHAEGLLPRPIKCHHGVPGNFQKGQGPHGYQEVVQQPRSSEEEFKVCTVSNN